MSEWKKQFDASFEMNTRCTGLRLRHEARSMGQSPLDRGGMVRDGCHIFLIAASTCGIDFDLQISRCVLYHGTYANMCKHHQIYLNVKFRKSICICFMAQKKKFKCPYDEIEIR